MFQVLSNLTLLLIMTSSLTPFAQENQGPNGIVDPMEDVVPIDVRPSSANHHTSRDLLDFQAAKSASVASKRFADKQQLVLNTQTRQINNRQSLTETIDQVTAGECAYTFIVPREAAQTPVCSNTKQQYLNELHEDVLAAKLQVEEVRNEIREEKRRLSNSNVISTMQEKIRRIERESVNMDQRVSQLYMQLLHEIINKRDNSIEVQGLETKLLNQTIRYHQLLEDHKKLEQKHNALQELVINQSKDLKNIHQQLDQLKLQTRICKCSDEARSESKSTNARPCQDNESNMPPLPPTTNFPPGPFRDCTEVQRAGYVTSGTFNLKLPTHSKKIRVWCDLEQDPGGWIVIQRRSGRRTKFRRSLGSYQRGFGRPHGDHWLGLENLYQLTNQTGINYKLQIELEDWDGKRKFAEYQSFRVGHESTGYQLKITHYSGNAGDSLTWHNNMAFSATDVDNDLSESNCAATHHGGWWYRDCARSNLNGIYYKGHYTNRIQDGVYWTSWRGTTYSLKTVVMKIRTLE